MAVTRSARNTMAWMKGTKPLLAGRGTFAKVAAAAKASSRRIIAANVTRRCIAEAGAVATQAPDTSDSSRLMVHPRAQRLGQRAPGMAYPMIGHAEGNAEPPR